MLITTFNVNGIRAACRKGLGEWLQRHQPDIVCLQEIRAEESEIPREILNPENYHAHFFAAEKKGYSGVALLSKTKPDEIQKGFHLPEFVMTRCFLLFCPNPFLSKFLQVPHG